MRRAIALGSGSQVPAATGGIVGPAQTDPDDHIADDGCGTSRGPWKQAEIAGGMIFGLTADTEDDGIFGSDPWSGRTLDLDEVDDAIESLEDAIAPLSDLRSFEGEFEDWTVATNSVS